MLQKFCSIILSSLLIFQGNIYASDTTTIDKHIRNNSTVNLLTGSKVNDMPYGYFIGQFGKSSIKAFSNQDFGSLQDKKVFVGYGTYDAQQENCRYLDVLQNATTFKNDFETELVTNNSTYAVSRNKMTFAQCKAKAIFYSAYVFTPRDSFEGIMAYNHFGKDKDIWVGYSKANCIDGEYLNDENIKQSFENFTVPVGICSDENRFTYKSENTYIWDRTDSADSHYCGIKFNSPDYKRPIQVCLPWWRIEREWKLPASDDKFAYNGIKYDFNYMQYLIDYPKDVTICTKVNTDAQLVNKNFRSTIRTKTFDSETNQYLFNDQTVSCLSTQNVALGDYGITFSANCSIPTASTLYNHTSENFNCVNTDINNSVSTASCYQSRPSYEQTCKSYYDIKRSPVCVNNITDQICQVDECAGYIKNVCVKTGTVEQFKNYDIGYIIVDGIETKTKVKAEKVISTYKCPVPNPPSSSCQEKSLVSVFPVHCPNKNDGTPSKCKELALCIQDKNNTLEECKSEFYCEKSYGSADNILYDANGKARALGGVCEDGTTQIEALIQVKDTTKMTCTLFDEQNVTTESFRKCTTSSAASNHVVDESITADDAYLLNERCIRTNNIEEARPDIPSVFEYETKGFFKTAIQKAYIDNTDETHDSNSSTEYLVGVTKIIQPESDINTTQSTPIVEPQSADDIAVEQFCDNTFSQQWMNRFYSTDENDNGEPYPSIKGILHSNTSGGALEKCRTTATLKNDRCEYNTPACGSFLYQSSDDTCRDSSSNIKPFNCSDYGTRIGNICYEDKWYKYPMVIVGTDKNICDSYKTSLGMAINTKGNVFYDDYDFEAIGVSNADIVAKSMCILGGNMIQGDEIFKVSQKSSGQMNYTTKNNVNEKTCSDLARCVAGSATTTYNSSTETKECGVNVSSLDESTEDNDPTIAPFENVSINYSESSGSFASDFNGYKDIFAIQEYTDGAFGYVSNYMFTLPRSNIVKVDNREVYPIIEQSPILFDLKHDYRQVQNTQTTKNVNPYIATAITGIMGYSAYSYLGASATTAALSAYMAVAIGTYLIVALTGKKQYWGWYDSYYRLYETLDVPPRYVPNVYGYDPRKNENGVLLWDGQDIKTSTLKRNQYSSIRSNLIAEKKDRFKIMGFSDTVINSKLISTNEKTPIGGHGIKWYKATANKRTTSDSGSQTVAVEKSINTIYMGAVNGVSIIVPYEGEYEIRAFDKNNNLLGTKQILKDDFISGSEGVSGVTTHTYAKVQFSTASDFNIAPEQNKEISSGSCLGSSFVEWGGGVSGAYYEKGVPDIGLGSNCFKSNDNYVFSHSAVRLTVNAINSPVIFNIRLKKPMPYPNRIQLVNFMNQETRKYQCWTNLSPCNVADSEELEEK